MLLLLLLLVCDMTDLWIFIRCHPVVAICIFWFEWSWVSQVMCIYMYIFIFWHFKWGPQLLAFLSIYSSMGTNIFQKTRLKLCFRPQRIKVWLKCTWVCYYCILLQRLHLKIQCVTLVQLRLSQFESALKCVLHFLGYESYNRRIFCGQDYPKFHCMLMTIGLF